MNKNNAILIIVVVIALGVLAFFGRKYIQGNKEMLGESQLLQQNSNGVPSEPQQIKEGEAGGQRVGPGPSDLPEGMKPVRLKEGVEPPSGQNGGVKSESE